MADEKPATAPDRGDEPIAGSETGAEVLRALGRSEADEKTGDRRRLGLLAFAPCLASVIVGVVLAIVDTDGSPSAGEKREEALQRGLERQQAIANYCVTRPPEEVKRCTLRMRYSDLPEFAR